MKLQGAIFDTRDTLLDETGSPLPGLMPFLSWMKMEGVWMYALCDGNMNETRQALEQAGLWSYFRGILDAREHGKGMADPVVYERTVKRLRTAPRATPVFTWTGQRLQRDMACQWCSWAVGERRSPPWPTR